MVLTQTNGLSYCLTPWASLEKKPLNGHNVRRCNSGDLVWSAKRFKTQSHSKFCQSHMKLYKFHYILIPIGNLPTLYVVLSCAQPSRRRRVRFAVSRRERKAPRARG